jgi:deazaflavin-dependent oxidoreductase (nitroreductase family)
MQPRPSTTLSATERFFNGLLGKLFRLGWAPAYGHELEVVGRKSGSVHRTPVNLLEQGGVRYLVAPRGETQWVKNARASGEVTLCRGASRARYRAVELPVAERAPILQDYLKRWENQVARFFTVRADAPLADFAAVAEQHPVFRLEAV